MTLRTTSRRGLLLLGGTQEAVQLAECLVKRHPWTVITSLAGRTMQPRSVVSERRIGSFGGVKGLYTYLTTNDIRCVVDATHPFATRISQNAAIACFAAMVPRIRLDRAPWMRQAADQWIDVPSMTIAALSLPSKPARIFLTVGRQQLRCFTIREDLWFLVRLIESLSVDVPLTNAVYVYGRGPFDVESERHLLKDYGIDMVVSKNSGGQSGYAKILAARSLGLPVVMVSRPPTVAGVTVSGIDEVLTWLEAIESS